MIDVFSPANYPPEKVSSIKLTTGGPYRQYILMTVTVKDIKAGDRLLVNADFQVTTELDYIVMVCSGVSIGNTWVCPKNGTNIGHATHHYPRSRTGWWEADKDYDQLDVNLIVYSASTSAKPNDTIKVDLGYGSMSVAKFNKTGVPDAN